MNIIKQQAESSHWYYPDGRAAYEMPKAKGDGTTPTTLRHAKKLGNLLPSVTTYLKVLAKPALERYKIEQAVYAVLTTPRVVGEADDAFVNRVLNVDKEQDSERDAAAQLGTDIHQAIEDALNGRTFLGHLEPYVMPTLTAVYGFGEMVMSEDVLIGKGYAGRTDAVMKSADEVVTVVDFKTTKAKKLPTESYYEHQLQLAAYLESVKAKVSAMKYQTCNIYISTINAGEVSVCVNDCFAANKSFEAFQALQKVWQHQNDYTPKQ